MLSEKKHQPAKPNPVRSFRLMQNHFFQNLRSLYPKPLRGFDSCSAERVIQIKALDAPSQKT
jgi:hypothetical protein